MTRPKVTFVYSRHCMWAPRWTSRHRAMAFGVPPRRVSAGGTRSVAFPTRAGGYGAVAPDAPRGDGGKLSVSVAALSATVLRRCSPRGPQDIGEWIGPTAEAGTFTLASRELAETASSSVNSASRSVSPPSRRVGRALGPRGAVELNASFGSNASSSASDVRGGAARPAAARHAGTGSGASKDGGSAGGGRPRRAVGGAPAIGRQTASNAAPWLARAADVVQSRAADAARGVLHEGGSPHHPQGSRRSGSLPGTLPGRHTSSGRAGDRVLYHTGSGGSSSRSGSHSGTAAAVETAAIYSAEWAYGALVQADRLRMLQRARFVSFFARAAEVHEARRSFLAWRLAVAACRLEAYSSEREVLTVSLLRCRGAVPLAEEGTSHPWPGSPPCSLASPAPSQSQCVSPDSVSRARPRQVLWCSDVDACTLLRVLSAWGRHTCQGRLARAFAERQRIRRTAVGRATFRLSRAGVRLAAVRSELLLRAAVRGWRMRAQWVSEQGALFSCCRTLAAWRGLGARGLAHQARVSVPAGSATAAGGSEGSSHVQPSGSGVRTERSPATTATGRAAAEKPPPQIMGILSPCRLRSPPLSPCSSISTPLLRPRSPPAPRSPSSRGSSVAKSASPRLSSVRAPLASPASRPPATFSAPGQGRPPITTAGHA